MEDRDYDEDVFGGAGSDDDDQSFLLAGSRGGDDDMFELESGDDDDEEDEEEEEVRMLSKKAVSFAAEAHGDESFSQELDDLPKDLKNRPVVTHRTISLMSSSAPPTQFQNFLEASLNAVIPNKHPERQYAEEEGPPSGSAFPSVVAASVRAPRCAGLHASIAAPKQPKSFGSPHLEKAKRSRLRDRDRWGGQENQRGRQEGEDRELSDVKALDEESGDSDEEAAAAPSISVSEGSPAVDQKREKVESSPVGMEFADGREYPGQEMPWPRRGGSFFPPPSPEHERRISRVPETETEETTDRLNLLRLDDRVVVGSVPKQKFIDEVLVQGTNSKWNVPQESSCKQRRRRSVKAPAGQAQRGQQQKAPTANKANRHRQFITIPTLSFNDRLSPETPQFVLGSTARNAKKLLITVAIHGDEPCGMIAFNELLREGFFNNMPKNLQLTALVGNPAAVVQRKRFIEFNMNRIIREDFFRKKHYECERGRVVARAISLCDVLLDLHSCSADAPAHALPGADASSVTIASRLPVAYVIKNLVHTTEGQATTVDWAVNHNKIGLCVECGQHDKRETVENAKAVIRTMVNAEYVTVTEATSKPVILHSTENEKVRKGFKFTRKIKAFDCIPFGETIAQDDIVGEIKGKYKKGTYVVMPTSRPVLGEEAFFYAKLSSVKKLPLKLF